MCMTSGILSRCSRKASDYDEYVNIKTFAMLISLSHMSRLFIIFRKKYASSTWLKFKTLKQFSIEGIDPVTLVIFIGARTLFSIY